MRKIAKFAIIILLGAIFLFASCNNDRPIPFDRDRWIESGFSFGGKNFLTGDGLIRGNTRHRMALWLEKNYSFDDKSLNDVLENFFIIPDNFKHFNREFEAMKTDRVLRIGTRYYRKIVIDSYRRPLPFIFIPINRGWLEFHFDENLVISKMYNVQRERGTRREVGNTTRQRIKN